MGISSEHSEHRPLGLTVGPGAVVSGVVEVDAGRPGPRF